jgi:hypothetical protein
MSHEKNPGVSPAKNIVLSMGSDFIIRESIQVPALVPGALPDFIGDTIGDESSNQQVKMMWREMRCIGS